MDIATRVTPAGRSRMMSERQFIRLGESLRESLHNLETAQTSTHHIWGRHHEYKEALARVTEEVCDVYTAVDAEYAAEFGKSVGKLKRETRYRHGSATSETDHDQN